MTANIEKITCNFIGDFEIADNIVRNANALCRLSETNDKGVFNKLMLVQAGSITEAALEQIIFRAQNYNREGVPNISEDDRKKIENTTIERFNNILQAMQKYKILDGLGDKIYGELEDLRKYRNKVHIQLDVGIDGVSRREDLAFSDKTMAWSLDLCVRVLKHLNERFPRPKALEQYAREISIPTA